MSQYIGDVSAYVYAVNKGYTGTEEEFAELMASYATVGQTAVDAKDAAVAANTAAQTAATTATNKASEATTAATTATTKAGEASQSASQASASAQTASMKASEASALVTTATEKATEATTAAGTATTAKDDAVTAKTAAETAQGKAEDAQEAAEDAAESVSASAAQIATNTADISDIKENLNDKAPVIVETASGSIASFTDGADGMPMKSLVVSIDPVQSGSGDPSPDNVRPISGWTGVTVQRTGVNVWDEEWEVGDINRTTGENSYSSTQIRSKNYIPVLPDTGYYIHVTKSGGSDVAILYYDKNKGFLSAQWGSNLVRTTPNNCYYIRFTSNSTYGGTYEGDISINNPSADTEYHSYNGTTVNVDWQTEAGTVYGGTLDIVSGVLTVDRAYGQVTAQMLSQLSSDYIGYNTSVTVFNGSPAVWVRNLFYNSGAKSRVSDGIKAVCNAFVISFNNTNFSSLQNRCAFKVDGVTIDSVEDFISAVQTMETGGGGLYIAYELATPITYQLTPTEVQSILGQNHMWADTGDVSVEYRADTKLYIQRLTQPEEDDMIADSAITSGQFFMIGNSLYRALANIASGATITVGTNAQRVSLADALNLINS